MAARCKAISGDSPAIWDVWWDVTRAALILIHHLAPAARRRPVAVVREGSTMQAAASSALQRILDPVGRCLTPDVARALLGVRTDAETQARLEELADKSTEGTLTEAERNEYQAYVSAIDFLTVLQSKARAVLAGAAGA